jgi:hypothetical protein
LSVYLGVIRHTASSVDLCMYLGVIKGCSTSLWVSCSHNWSPISIISDW